MHLAAPELGQSTSLSRMGSTGQPPPGGGPGQSSSQPGMTSAWAGGTGAAGQSRKQRSFAEIMADQRQNRNILEIIFNKIEKVDNDGNITKHRNLVFDEIGTFMFDVLKIDPSECLRFNFTSGRYDTKEIMFKPGVDINQYVGQFEFMEHEVITRKQRRNITKIVFKNVPLNIPDEEIVNLVESYGKPTDFTVHYEKLTNSKNRGMEGGTRFMEAELFPGAAMNNYYWLEGPLSGDTGSRVTVLHPGQVQQCSNCLKLANNGCPGKGNGKACVSLGTARTTMTTYMEFIKVKHGYRSLKTKYYEQFPNLGGAGNFGISDIPENVDDEGEIVPMNPVVEKDRQIAELKKALETSEKELSDISAIKDNLVKTKNELQISKKFTAETKKRLDAAKKLTEKRMSNCLLTASPQPGVEEELVNLYTALVDDDTFQVVDNKIIPATDFLKDVEENLVKKGENSEEKKQFEQFKNKILEKMKSKKQFRDRKQSISQKRRGENEQSRETRLKAENPPSKPN